MSSLLRENIHAHLPPLTTIRKPRNVLSKIRLRLFRESDLPEIRSLFSSAFPITYNDDFFECVRVQFFRGNKLMTYIAETLEGVGFCYFSLTYRILLN